MMQLIDRYVSYWPIFAAVLLFFALGLWWRLSAARAMERAPKSPDWVRRYRSGGFPFRRELLGSPKLCWWALLLTLLLGAGFMAAHLINSGMYYSKQPEPILFSRYGIILTVTCAVGAGAVYCLLKLLFASDWVGLPGALLFAASASRGFSERSFLAVALLFLLLYLRAEKPGFPSELLYLAAILAAAPILALRPGLVWLLICLPIVHWYKLISQRRARQLSGGALAGSLLAALASWCLLLILAAVLLRFLMIDFHLSALTSIFHTDRFLATLRFLLNAIKSRLFAAPTRGMTIDLMVDAPLLGMGFWGCCSAWTLAKQRRDARGVFALTVLAALLLAWLLTGVYAVTLGLVLTAACALWDADAAKQRIGVILLTLAGICWYVLIQLAAWQVPLAPGLLEHLF